LDAEFFDNFNEMIEDKSLDQQMNLRMMAQIQVTFDDLDSNDSFGFDNLSLERYRQNLSEELNKEKAKYRRLPKEVYTGFKTDTIICAEIKLIAFLGYSSKPVKQQITNIKFLT